MKVDNSNPFQRDLTMAKKYTNDEKLNCFGFNKKKVSSAFGK